jgi:hypothetical protein
VTLLLDTEAFARRRAVAAGPLRPLADSLAADLEPWLATPPFVPAQKALLSRAGGRCDRDGTELEFDPASPQAHRCPSCGHLSRGELHERWWLYPYQLWLAERAVHAALLCALGGDPRHAAFARTVLREYAEQYLQYPNVDNVLGPSRLFFSTYLESLWLLHICVAADLVAYAGDTATADIVRGRVVAPAAALIGEYHEGLSNRQVWNAAALVAAHTLLGATPDAAPIADALYDIERILVHAVGPDGSWYEGDNYHQFAHRGLWYAVTLGERIGYRFEPTYLARYDAGFASPFLAALPDFTYPARKDSRYAASLRQWRFAESCELGLARRDDPVLRWALSRMYADDLPRGDTGRSRSSGEAERHVAPVRLSRADLGWRSLLFARAELGDEPGVAPRSLTILSQGLTIHRRDRGGVYVALDWGVSGGGHGHPDRLNLLFSHGNTRWLDDLGTGSYVDRSLHWYRSTLAHNAPLIDGRSQRRVAGILLAAGGRGEFEIAAARVHGLAPGVVIDRAVVTGATYFVDHVRWAASEPVRFELPVHLDASCDGLRFRPASLDGGRGTEDGFDFVHDAESATLAARVPLVFSAVAGDRQARAVFWSDRELTVFRVRGPGNPAAQERRFYVLRAHAGTGVVRSVWDWGAGPFPVRFGDDAVSVTAEDASHTHHIDATQWSVEAPGAMDVVFALTESMPAGDEPHDADPAAPPAEPHRIPVLDAAADWFSDLTEAGQRGYLAFHLGEASYRRSEQAWRDAGAPRARVAMVAVPEGLVLDVAVATPAPTFVARDAINDLDNEAPDINGHGVQLYLATPAQTGAWVIVPEPPHATTRVRRVPGWGDAPDPSARWRLVADGFELRILLPIEAAAGPRLALDLIVNDAAPGRSRRRGQLVLSGAAGEFVYLRGDRHDPARLMPFVVNRRA